MSDARDRQYSGAAVVLVGLLVATVPAFDIYDDAVGQSDPVWTTVVENLPLLALSGLVVASGVWLARSDWAGRYARTVARLTVGAVAGVAVLIALVVFVQFRLQGELKPLIIAADAVVIGALGGVVIGARTAQQRRAVDDARHQRNRAEALFENHTDAVAVVSRAGDGPVVTGVNRTFEEVFGYAADEIDDLGELAVTADAGATEAGTDIFEGRDDSEPTRREVTRETAGGEREFIRQTVPVASTGGPTREAYVVYTDITAQKEREHQLEFLNSLLRHEIQNGMTVIRSRAEHLAERLDGRNATFAATIEERSNDVVELVDRFRAMLDALTGDIDEEVGPVALDEVVEEQAAVLRTSYPEADVSTDVASRQVRADRLLETVVWNLLSNAVEHNDAETPEVAVTTSDRDGTVRLEVADNGPGIPDDLKEAVFRRNDSGVRNEVGSGFGLFFVDKMVTRYGGDVWARDRDPRGTVLVLALPAAG